MPYVTVLMLSSVLAAAELEPVKLAPVFDEDFKTLAAQRFKQVSSGAISFNVTAGTMTPDADVRLVRPGVAGFLGELTLKLEFPVLDKDGDTMLADFGLVLSNAKICAVRLTRTVEEGRTVAGLAVVLLEDDPGKKDGKVTVMRKLRWKGDLEDGTWKLRYHHGELVISHEGKEVGRADVSTVGAAIVGVSWNQYKGRLACAGMSLSGRQPPPLTQEQQNVLRQAVARNNQARMHLNQGNLDDALAASREASALFVKVHGEAHHDSANSFENLGTVLGKAGKLEEAIASYERALAVRKQVLGPTHPQTGLTLFWLGTLLQKQGKHDDAKAHFEQSLRIFEPVLDEENALLKGLRRAVGQRVGSGLGFIPPSRK